MRMTKELNALSKAMEGKTQEEMKEEIQKK